MSTETTSPGLHHVTAIAGDPQRNHAFYTDTLGLRMVKQTVNFDDPTTYHLYYGDRIGAPGTIMTFFPWVNLPKGRVGLGQAVLTQFTVPRGSLAFWTERLDRLGKGVLSRETVFGEVRLISLDPDGLPFALVEAETPPASETPERLWAEGGVPAAFAIRGFFGITLALSHAQGTADVLTKIFGYSQEAETDWPKGESGGRLIRFRSPAADGLGAVVDIHEAPGMAEGASGGGTVHHIAFSTPTRASQAEIRERLLKAGHQVTPSIDRNYFWAIYFRSPGGVLFEVATDEPGFAADEPRESLGQSLKLPPQYEASRERIQAALPPLAV